MAGRGMGAASRGGGAVGKGPKNKMISEPSKSTGKVLMMAKGGLVPKGTPVRKYQVGGFVPPMNAQQLQQYYRTKGNAIRDVAGLAGAIYAARSKSPTVKNVKTAGILAGTAKGLKDFATGSDREQAFIDMFDDSAPQISATPDEEGLQYRRGGAVRKKDYLKKKAKMGMRKGGMADKEGRAMKSKSKDSRGRAMRGY